MIVENKEYAPYFQAFILHKGFQVGDEFPNHEYIIWNQQKWREWRRLNGIPADCPATKEHQVAFGKWLFETMPKTHIAKE